MAKTNRFSPMTRTQLEAEITAMKANPVVIEFAQAQNRLAMVKWNETHPTAKQLRDAEKADLARLRALEASLKAAEAAKVAPVEPAKVAKVGK